MPADTGRKLNVHKTLRRRPGRLLNVLCTFSLRPVSTMMSKNIFSDPYINNMAIERLQGEEEFPSKNYLLVMPRSHAKMLLKSAPQKLNFLMATDISESYN